MPEEENSLQMPEVLIPQTLELSFGKYLGECYTETKDTETPSTYQDTLGFPALSTVQASPGHP